MNMSLEILDENLIQKNAEFHPPEMTVPDPPGPGECGCPPGSDGDHDCTDYHDHSSVDFNHPKLQELLPRPPRQIMRGK